MQLHDLKKATDTFTNGKKMPVWFIGHGNPMNALADNAFTKSLATTAQSLNEKPTAILVISAHWLTRKGTYVAITEKPETIYDFYGFPDDLYNIKYPAPGAPMVAREVKKLITTAQVQEDKDWGLDHGAWTVLKHAFPEATIPVFQMSIDYAQPAEYHFKLASELQSLRNKGVLIIGSGNIVHNLKQANFFEAHAPAYAWASDFDEISKQKILNREFRELVNYENLGPAALLAVPTPDHYFPMLYSLGLVTDKDEVKFTFEEIQNASVSMRCFTIQ
jgi:4,5-DOPA dioxygenase extradiol